jgi:hypothetical protein
MENQNALASWLLPLLFIGIGFALVYAILPRIFKNYSTEKGVKLVLLYGIMTYLSIDFYKQEKYTYIAFFAAGAILFTYLTWIAKKKV